jgi:DNA invertase Pin-like site-specific DNA recombinase
VTRRKNEALPDRPYVLCECLPSISKFETKGVGRRRGNTSRVRISTRTRQVLSTANARGVTLGNPKRHKARKNAVDAVKTEADRYAANVLPIIREAQKAGARTLREIADALNARGIATARGGQWYAQSVANVLARA